MGMQTKEMNVDILTVINVDMNGGSPDLGNTRSFLGKNKIKNAEKFFCRCVKDLDRNVDAEDLENALTDGYYERPETGSSVFLHWNRAIGRVK